MDILVLLLVGLVAGWLAGLVVGGGLGLVGDIVVGVIGAFIGGWLLRHLGIAVGYGTLGRIITATIGAILEESARDHQSPMSSKSHTGRVCPAWKAISLPRSSAEPPPKAMTPSCLPFLKAAMPAVRFDSTGFGLTSEKTP